MLKLYTLAGDLLTELPSFSLAPVNRGYALEARRGNFGVGVHRVGDGLANPMTLTLQGGVRRSSDAQCRLARDTILQYLNFERLWLEAGDTRYLIGGIASVNEDIIDQRQFVVRQLAVSIYLIVPFEFGKKQEETSILFASGGAHAVATLRNEGTAPLYPILTLSEATGAEHVDVSVGSSSLSWQGLALSPTSQLKIDNLFGTITVDGVSALRDIQDGSTFLSVPVGDTLDIIVTTFDGSPYRAFVEWYQAFQL